MYNEVKFVLIVCSLFEMYLIHEEHRKEKFFIVLNMIIRSCRCKRRSD